MTESNVIRIRGTPNEKQKLFFSSKAKYTAYGGARGGGKSWALRRKLIGLCLRYPSIRCLLIRRTYAELKANHLSALLAEYGEVVSYSESEKAITLKNGSHIFFGYCSSDRDLLRYQGQEYDIIAIAFAEQLSEVEAYRPELRFADAVKGLMLFGAKIVYPDEIAVIELATA